MDINAQCVSQAMQAVKMPKQSLTASIYDQLLCHTLATRVSPLVGRLL